MGGDLRAALRFTNERHVKELLGEEYLGLVGQFADEIDRVHEGLTGAIWAGINRNRAIEHVLHYVEEAAHLRCFLG